MPTIANSNAATKAEIAQVVIDEAVFGYTYSGADTAELQAVIDAAETAGGGRVIVPVTTTITGTSTLTVPADVILELNPAVVITTAADIDIVSVEFNGQLRGNGAKIYGAHASFSKACLLLDASAGNFHFVGNKTRASDVLLEGPSDEIDTGCKGLHLYASGSANAIQACNFDNIICNNLDYAIYEEVVGVGGIAYINGNNLSNIMVDNCRYLITQSVSGTGITGINSNVHSGIKCQAGTGMLEGINCVGSGNYFSGTIFDWNVAAGSYAIIGTSTDTSPNVFDIPLLPEYVSITAGSEDIVLNLERGGSYLPRINLTNIGVTPDACEGMVGYNIANNSIAWSTGGVWASVGGQYWNTLPNLTTTHTATLTAADVGPGVGWTSAGADATYTVLLPAAAQGMEVIISNSNQITDLVRSGSNTFEDLCGSGASDASIGVSSAQNLRLPSGTAYAHLRCYIGTIWSIVASRKTLAYV